MDDNNDLTLFEAEEMPSPFDAIKQVDASGKAWWNSRKLAKVLGYAKYWNFERLIEKVSVSFGHGSGLHLSDHLSDHLSEVEEMVRLGGGTFRKVKSYLFSETFCLAIAMNADEKKPMVRSARQYFSGSQSVDLIPNILESNVLLYRSERGNINVAVVFNDETFWLSQKRMSDLFGVDVTTVNYHLQHIYDSNELSPRATIRKIPIVQTEGGRDVSRPVQMYNLDAVIAVGYRVNSYEATQFRIWATNVLKEFMVKGFVIDDERMKRGQAFGADYFEELLERIREIRTSERRYYQKITDIYAECSSDYNPKADTTRHFYKTVQNMMHWAVTHQTAAEIIFDRADADKPNMGLTSWKNAPDGRIVRSDVTVAKNYLTEHEINDLNLLSTSFLDMAELRAQRHILMTMKDWSDYLKKFLQGNEYEVLEDGGKVTHEEAEVKALEEYGKYRLIQDREFLSDFDNFLRESQFYNGKEVK